MYHVRIRDHIMIAHSLDHPGFGPAKQKHGATYVVDVVFYSDSLNELNVVIDIGLAHRILKEVLSEWNYKDLDRLSAFENKLTTTEFLARHIHDSVKEKAKSDFDGRIEVILGESHIAWAGYKGR